MSYCETIRLVVCLTIRLCQTGWLGVVYVTSTEVHNAYINIILLFNRPDHSKHYVSPGGQNSSHKPDWGAVRSIQALAATGWKVFRGVAVQLDPEQEDKEYWSFLGSGSPCKSWQQNWNSKKKVVAKADEEARRKGFSTILRMRTMKMTTKKKRTLTKTTRNCSISLTVSDVRISSEKRQTFKSTLRIVRICRLPMIAYDVYCLWSPMIEIKYDQIFVSIIETMLSLRENWFW